MTQVLIDRQRATREMTAAGVDALVLFQPEHVAWAIGVHPGPAALFRRAGAASVVIAADASVPVLAVMPDLAMAAVRTAQPMAEVAYHRIWVDTAVARPHNRDAPLSALLDTMPNALRPATVDPSASFGMLREQLSTHGLSAARLGLDLAFVPAADLTLLAPVLPHATLLDATQAVRRVRMIKTTTEVARLRTALELSEAGLAAAMRDVRSGVTRDDLGRTYAAGVRTAAALRGHSHASLWDYISVGPDPWGVGRPAEDGDIIKFDVGVVIGGYSSDMARTMSCGAPSRAARELHAALLAGLEAGLETLRPGRRLCDVYTAMLQTIRAKGVVGYTRGHFGHGLGNDPFSEQWPFIAADCDVVAEPGMVLAVEAPHYVDGLGGFIIEDQVLVTETGIDVMSRSPRELIVRS